MIRFCSIPFSVVILGFIFCSTPPCKINLVSLEDTLAVYKLCSLSVLVKWTKRMVSNFEVKFVFFHEGTRTILERGQNPSQLSLCYLCSVRVGLGI